MARMNYSRRGAVRILGRRGLKAQQGQDLLPAISFEGLGKVLAQVDAEARAEFRMAADAALAREVWADEALNAVLDSAEGKEAQLLRGSRPTSMRFQKLSRSIGRKLDPSTMRKLVEAAEELAEQARSDYERRSFVAISAALYRAL